MNAGSIYEEILVLEEKEPRDKRSKEYKAWWRELNTLYQSYNDYVGWKVYKISKDEVRKRVQKKRDTSK